MQIRILYWNVRGANDSEKRKIIKAFLKTQREDLVCIQETNLKGTSQELVRSCKRSGSFRRVPNFLGFYTSSTNGKRGESILAIV